MVLHESLYMRAPQHMQIICNSLFSSSRGFYICQIKAIYLHLAFFLCHRHNNRLAAAEFPSHLCDPEAYIFPNLPLLRMVVQRKDVVDKFVHRINKLTRFFVAKGYFINSITLVIERNLPRLRTSKGAKNFGVHDVLHGRTVAFQAFQTSLSPKNFRSHCQQHCNQLFANTVKKLREFSFSSLVAPLGM